MTIISLFLVIVYMNYTYLILLRTYNDPLLYRGSTFVVPLFQGFVNVCHFWGIFSYIAVCVIIYKTGKLINWKISFSSFVLASLWSTASCFVIWFTCELCFNM